MKNYKKIFNTLASKGAIEVFLQIYSGCKTEEYPSFEEIRKSLRMSKFTLRRITNRLSRGGLICSGKHKDSSDGRKRVYMIENAELANLLEQICLL